MKGGMSQWIYTVSPGNLNLQGKVCLGCQIHSSQTPLPQLTLLGMFLQNVVICFHFI